MRRCFASFIIVLVLATSGCYRAIVRTGQPAAQQQPVSQIGLSFVYGLVGTTTTAAECTNGLAETNTSMPWWGGLVSGITLGLIMPWEIQYQCAAPK